MSCKIMYPLGEGFEVNNEVKWSQEVVDQTGYVTELKERTGELICKPFSDNAASDVWLIKPYDSNELVLIRESDMEAYYWA